MSAPIYAREEFALDSAHVILSEWLKGWRVNVFHKGGELGHLPGCNMPTREQALDRARILLAEVGVDLDALETLETTEEGLYSVTLTAEELRFIRAAIGTAPHNGAGMAWDALEDAKRVAD